MRTGALLLLSILAWSSCETNTRDFETILTFEMNRSSCDSLTSFLSAKEPRVRKRAIEAIGRIGSAECLDEVADCLEDLNHTVRAAAAFTLGQIGDRRAEPVLIQSFPKDHNPESKRRIVEALGRIGTIESIPLLHEAMGNPEALIRAEATLALGRLQSRGVSDSLDSLVVPALRDNDPNVRWRACHALKTGNAAARHQSQLLRCMDDTDTRVRIFAIRALTDTSSYSLLEPMAKALNSDSDWRVRVEAAKALGRFPLNLTASYLTLQEQIANVRIAILRAIGESARVAGQRYQGNSREYNIAKYQIEIVLKDSVDLYTSELGPALISYAKLMGPDAVDTILAFSHHPKDNVKEDVIHALAATGSRALANILTMLYPDADTRTRIAILEAAKPIADRGSTQLLLDGLKEDDTVIVALAADGLSADSLNAAKHFDRIIEAYLRLKKDFDIETRNMIFDAIARIDSEKTVAFLHDQQQSSDIQTAPDASELLAMSETDTMMARKEEPPFEKISVVGYGEIHSLRHARAIIKTRHGDISIQLRADEAPVTVLNFVRLAERGFYDGLTFHRVEPNFVVQGGDPRADSWGSPGYTIPSEYNQLSYLRGTVGMASAGKDTEGSQFFITYSPQPHLDGRYTVFGQVEDGMEIVDELEEGDVMKLVAISR